MEAISLKTSVKVMISALLLVGMLHPGAARGEDQDVVLAQDHIASASVASAVPDELPNVVGAQSVELSYDCKNAPYSGAPVSFAAESEDSCFQECTEFCPEDCEDDCSLGYIACGACLVACDIGCAIGCGGVDP